MARVYLMIEDLPVQSDADVSIGWAVQWDGDNSAKPSPESLSDAQWAMEQIEATLQRMVLKASAMAAAGSEADRVSSPARTRSPILVPAYLVEGG